MKKKSILFVLALILIALTVSCNDDGGLFEDAANRAASSDLTILSILGASNSDIYFLSQEKGVHKLETSSYETMLLVKKSSQNFWNAAMANDKIYISQYEDSAKNIKPGQIAEYDLEGNFTSQTNLVFKKLAPNGYGLDDNNAVYLGTGSTNVSADEIIYANGSNVILKSTSPSDVYYINSNTTGITSDVSLMCCTDKYILAKDKTIRNASDNTVVSTITDISFTIASNPIGFEVDDKAFFRGEKNFADKQGDIVTADWTKPFNTASVEITGAITIESKVYISTKTNGIWCVDFSNSTPESKRVL